MRSKKKIIMINKTISTGRKIISLSRFLSFLNLMWTAEIKIMWLTVQQNHSISGWEEQAYIIIIML